MNSNQYNKFNVFIGTPMYNGQCQGQYVKSLIDNIIDIKSRGHDFDYIFPDRESLIVRGRNMIADIFLKKTTCTHLFFIDADIVFPSHAIRTLIEQDKDVIFTPYPKKIIDWEKINVARLANNVPSDFIKKLGAVYGFEPLSTSNLDRNVPVEVKQGQTGFMCIKRSVLEKMSNSCRNISNASHGAFSDVYKEFFSLSISEAGIYQSEDMDFCNKWRGLGGKIHMLAGIHLGHIGQHTYEGDLFTILDMTKQLNSVIY